MMKMMVTLIKNLDQLLRHQREWDHLIWWPENKKPSQKQVRLYLMRLWKVKVVGLLFKLRVMPKRHLQDHQPENLPKRHSHPIDLNLVLKTNQRSQINLGVINLHRDLVNLLKWLYKEMIRQTRANQKLQTLPDAMPHPRGLASTLKWLCKITTIQLIHQRHQLKLLLNTLGSMRKWQCKVTMIL